MSRVQADAASQPVQPASTKVASGSQGSVKMRTRVVSGWTVQVPATPSPPPPMPSASDREYGELPKSESAAAPSASLQIAKEDTSLSGWNAAPSDRARSDGSGVGVS